MLNLCLGSFIQLLRTHTLLHLDHFVFIFFIFFFVWLCVCVCLEVKSWEFLTIFKLLSGLIQNYDFFFPQTVMIFSFQNYFMLLQIILVVHNKLSFVKKKKKKNPLIAADFFSLSLKVFCRYSLKQWKLLAVRSFTAQ